MARPRKPTALKLLNGSAKTNPGRLNNDEPETAPITEEKVKVPRGLGPEVSAIFLRIIYTLPPGVLAQCDTDLVQMTARLTHMMQRDFEGMTASHIAQLRSCWQQLGMTPSSRSGLKVPQKKDEKAGKFAGLGKKPPKSADPEKD